MAHNQTFVHLSHCPSANRFSPTVAPTKATVFPLVQKEALNEHASKISAALTAAGLSNIIDISGETPRLGGLQHWMKFFSTNQMLHLNGS